MPQIGRYPENMTIGQTIKMIQDIRKFSPKDIDTELLEAFELEKIYHKKNGNPLRRDNPKGQCCIGIYV